MQKCGYHSHSFSLNSIHMANTKPFSCNRDKCFLIAIVVAIFFLLYAFWSFRNQNSCFSTIFSPTNIDQYCPTNLQALNRTHDPQETTFYDDPEISYTIEKPIKNWDQKRKEWLNLHPSFTANAENRVFVLTGSQSSTCKNEIGDYLLMKCFKNKVDYCRIHGYEIFYNNAYLNSKMVSCWAKIPLIRAAMIAHPEAEWMLWIDSDAIFTDMDFKIPLQKYKNHNFVVTGSLDLLYEKKTWLAINAGVFLIRNCQWALDLLEVWASMGPISPNFQEWGETFSSTLTERVYVESDDQSALVYLLLTEKSKWGEKIYIEKESNSIDGYWVPIVSKIENITRKYEEIEEREVGLRRKHAEAVSEKYGEMWEMMLKDREDMSWDGLRRPFITHFAGCQPCSGDHNPMHEGDSCWVAMEKALKFADNQVLRNFGFQH